METVSFDLPEAKMIRMLIKIAINSTNKTFARCEKGESYEDSMNDIARERLNSINKKLAEVLENDC